MIETCPKQITLKSGMPIFMRPLEKSDGLKLFQFFAGLPVEATQFLKHDVRDPEVSSRFVSELDPDRVFCLLALTEDDHVVANATLHMTRRGWRRHVGEIRAVVAPSVQKQGLATCLIRGLVHRASTNKLKKLEAQVLGSQLRIKAALERLGFRQEARFKGHAIDLYNQRHDLLILTTAVHDLWQNMEDLIFEMDVTRALAAY